MYFVDGGDVTYADSSGEHDRGRWQMDPAGDVCIKWHERNQGHRRSDILGLTFADSCGFKGL